MSTGPTPGAAKALDDVGRHPIAFSIVLFVAISLSTNAATAKESGPIQSLELLRGPELLQFALERDHEFDLIDFETGNRGSVKMESGTLTIQWSGEISGYIAVLNEEQVCTKTEAGIKRCYAFFKPSQEFEAAGCVYLMQSVYEHRNACLKHIQNPP